MRRGDWTAGITARRAAEENTSLSVTLSIKIDSDLDNKTTLGDPDRVASEQFSSPSLDPREYAVGCKPGLTWLCNF